MSTTRVLIYLLRRDLRLADNPIFHEISKASKQSKHPYTHVLPLYVFPAQQVEVSGFLSSPDGRSPYPEARSQHGGFWRCGPRRATFLAESIWDLKTALEGVGSGLTVRAGLLGDVIRDLLEGFRKSGSAEVFGLWMTSEEGVEERREEQEVRRTVEADGKEFRLWVDEKYLIDEYVFHPRDHAHVKVITLGTDSILFKQP
jgi:deoxyribodipyrimidine photo-lyase